MARQMMEYQSKDYGVFLIQQEGKKWIIAWDPEEACEYHAIDQYQDLFDDLLTFCMANPNNLTSNDFKDLPKNGEFNSLDEAKNYIETKFGKII